MTCNKCKENKLGFSMGAYEANLNSRGEIVEMHYCVEYVCDECHEASNKYFIYECIGTPINMKSIACDNCGKSDKVDLPYIEMPAMEDESKFKEGSEFDATLEFKCKCSFFKRTTNRVNFKLKLVSVKDIDEIPEDFGM